MESRFREQTLGPYYITTKKHQYEISIKPNEYVDYIHLGSKHFKFCIEISIMKQNGIPQKGKLIQVKAEPECGFPIFLERGDSISMILATFQICKLFYPSVSIYEFEDDSNIECGIQSISSIPPRKMIKPLSLSYLSIATYGKTWYERHFNAKLLNQEKYTKYRKSIENLDYPISNLFSSYPEFIQKYYLNSQLQDSLIHYFDIEKTWFEFFQSIPKKQYCDIFYNWLPTCVSDIIESTFVNKGWYIDVNTLPRLNLKVTNTPVYKGGKKTRRNIRKQYIYFSNSSQGSTIV